MELNLKLGINIESLLQFAEVSQQVGGCCSTVYQVVNVITPCAVTEGAPQRAIFLITSRWFTKDPPNSFLSDFPRLFRS